MPKIHHSTFQVTKGVSKPKSRIQRQNKESFHARIQGDVSIPDISNTISNRRITRAMGPQKILKAIVVDSPIKGGQEGTIKLKGILKSANGGAVNHQKKVSFHESVKENVPLPKVVKKVAEEVLTPINDCLKGGVTQNFGKRCQLTYFVQEGALMREIFLKDNKTGVIRQGYVDEDGVITVQKQPSKRQIKPEDTVRTPRNWVVILDKKQNDENAPPKYPFDGSLRVFKMQEGKVMPLTDNSSKYLRI